MKIENDFKRNRERLLSDIQAARPNVVVTETPIVESKVTMKRFMEVEARVLG